MKENNKEIELLKSNYPNLKFNLNIEDNLISVVTSDNLNFLVEFDEIKILSDILEHFKGFQNLSFPYQKASIIIENSLYAYVEIPDLLEGIIYEEKGSSLVEENFLFHYKTKTYNVEIKQSYFYYIDENFSVKELVEEMKKNNFSREYINAKLGELMINKKEKNIIKIQKKFPHRARFYIIVREIDQQGKIKPPFFLKTDGLKMINSIIFDYYYNHYILLRPLNLEEFAELFSMASFYYPPDKMEPCMKEVNFRPIDEILLETLYVADGTQLPMYKFLSYYRILEYFFDKFAVLDVSNDIREIIIRPDFLNKIEYYTERIFRIVKNRDPRRQDDRKKLKYLFERFISEDILLKIKNLEVRRRLGEEIVLDGNLKLPSIIKKGKFDRGKLTERIYTLRCAIVHSNPDYNEIQKLIPYTYNNLMHIWYEGYFLRLVAIEVLGKASTYLL